MDKDATRRFRVAVVGCGAIHATHADALAEIPNVSVAAFCDVVPERAEASAARCGGRAETDWTRLLADPGIDAVHLCTPHDLHAPMARAFLGAGKHVFTEKPMGLSVDEGEAMVRAADESGRTLGVCFQNRCNATSLALRDLVRSGRAGRVRGARALLTWSRDAEYYTGSDWKGTWRREGGGVLINQAIHTIDLLQWALGLPAELKGTVDRRSLADVIEVEDTAEATFRHVDGTRTYVFATNGYVTDAPVEIEVVFEKATARLRGELVVTWDDGHVETVAERSVRTDAKAYWGGGHRDILRDFYECLAAGRPFALDGREGLQALRILRAWYESDRKRDWVRV